MMKNMYLPTETTAFAPSGRGYTRTSARGVASSCMLVGPSGRQLLISVLKGQKPTSLDTLSFHALKGQKHPTSGNALAYTDINRK
jgi:hypothetical protein